jgi:hypothetical protein
MTLKSKLIAGAAIVIAALVGAYLIDRAMASAADQKLATNAVQVTKRRSIAVVTQKAADVEVKKSVALRVPYHAARGKIVVKGDSVFADGFSLELPSVADFVNEADARVAQDSTSIVKTVASTAAVDSLVSSLDARVDLYKEAKRPRIGVKTGIAIGVVTTVAGVWLAVTVIKAIAGSHK